MVPTKHLDDRRKPQTKMFPNGNVGIFDVKKIWLSPISSYGDLGFLPPICAFKITIGITFMQKWTHWDNSWSKFVSDVPIWERWGTINTWPICTTWLWAISRNSQKSFRSEPSNDISTQIKVFESHSTSYFAKFLAELNEGTPYFRHSEDPNVPIWEQLGAVPMGLRSWNLVCFLMGTTPTRHQI